MSTIRAAVLGAGTWGTALAQLLADNGHAVRAWDVDGDLIEHLDKARKHPRLDAAIAREIRFGTDLDATLEGGDVVVLAVPSQAMRATGEAIARRKGKARDYVICTKGIEKGTHRLMHQVLEETVGNAGRFAVLSGPSHAEEVSRGLPTTVVAAASDHVLAMEVQRWFFRPAFRVYTHDDVLGVELGGAVKNVIAIAAGVADGLGLGDNARAALMTRGLAEIVRLGLAAGARLETFMGLSGLGDLIVTAGSKHSRNHAFGMLLAGGMAPEGALAKVGMVVEGYATAVSVRELAREHGVEMPIAESVCQVCYEGKAPREALMELMGRDPKPERY